MSMHIERRLERLMHSAPAHMESHASHRELAHPCCTLQQLHPDDLNTTMCDSTEDAERRAAVRASEETQRLYVQFVRAHGRPKGEFTTFSNGDIGKLNGAHEE